MSLLLDVPRVGAQEPVILHLPPDVHSLAAAEEAIELADAYGVCDGYPLSESQRITLRAGLGERVDGSWAAGRVGDFGPRQGTGKSDKIAARELAGLLLFGEQLIIHTAHEFPTANESFLRLVSVFENWDDLRKRVSRIRYANGEQGIELLTGQRLKYRARTGGSGRGFAKADLIVYDEAQHLTREHVAASGPAKLANPNSQTWYAGSGGMSTSVVAWALRKDAIFGRGGRLAYTEATAETVRVVDGRIVSTRPDPLDLEAWYRAIPGLGQWVSEESEQALLDELGLELFGRECLCVWDAELSADEPGDLDFERWLKLADPDAERGLPVFGVDVAEDRTASIAVLWRRDDNAVQMMLADENLSPLQLEERLGKLRVDWGGRVAVGGAAADVPADAVVNGVEFAAACGRFADLLASEGIRHGNQPTLNRAVQVARWRAYGSSGERAFKLKDAPEVGPLAAVVRGLHEIENGSSVYDTRGFVII